MAEQKILTLHPEGKQGVNIDKSKYDMVREAILGSLAETDSMKFMELINAVKKKLSGKFDGSVNWYATTVKLDLEARGEINCRRGKGGQDIKLAN
mgnify:CR=1 FL=1